MTKALSAVDELKANIVRLQPEFEKALPSQIPGEKFTRVVLTAIQMTPELVKADRTSLFASCMKCATDGLLPDGREAALVIFKTKAGPAVVYMPMIYGIVKKAYQSGEIAHITHGVVYETDVFKYWVDGSGENINYEPNMWGEKGKRLGAFAMAKMKSGSVYAEIMSEPQILAVKNTSKAKDWGPWSGPFEDEMWRKTVFRRLAKRLPSATDLNDVLSRDDEMYDMAEKKPEAALSAGHEPAAPATRLEGLINEPAFDDSGSWDPVKK